MAEPSVQPPTREQIEQAVAEGNGWPKLTVDLVLALFPQPTPSAEPTYHVECLDGCGVYSYRGQPLDWASREAGRHMRDYNGHRANVVVEKAPTPAEPVSIADMAPGTTFTEATDGWPRSTWGVGLRLDGTRYIARLSDGWLRDPKGIDPSTIRDVTPPPTTPEGGR